MFQFAKEWFRLAKSGGLRYAVVGDLTNDDEVQRLIEDARALVKTPIEIVVNNAGGSGEREDWATTLPESWATGYDRSAIAAVRVTTRLLLSMRAAKWGRIVNITSLAALMPPPKRPDYAAAKAATIAMTGSLAKAVAMDGITANTVSPGTIHSVSLDEAFRKAALKRSMRLGRKSSELSCRCLPRFQCDGSVPLRRSPTRSLS